LQDTKATDALVESFDQHKDIKQIPVDILADNLDKAIDVKKNREDEMKPGKLIDRAISALNGIDRKGKHFKNDPDVKIKLGSLEKLVSQMKTDLGLK
jgi:hypothetical protein